MTTICSRYSNDDNGKASNCDLTLQPKKSPSLSKKSESKISLLDQTVVINDEDCFEIEKKSQLGKAVSNVGLVKNNENIEAPRKNYVSNLISGLRQRKWIRGRGRVNNLVAEKDYIDDPVIISSLGKDLEKDTISV
jgi:hypothetical protein